MTNRSMNRRECREFALLSLFQVYVGKNEPEVSMSHVANLAEVSIDPFAKELVLGVYENKGKIDSAIEQNTENWTVNRIGNVELNALRIATFEMMKGEEPPKVIVNEAIELVKMFSDDSAKKFANSVLQKLMSELM